MLGCVYIRRWLQQLEKPARFPRGEISQHISESIAQYRQACGKMRSSQPCASPVFHLRPLELSQEASLHLESTTNSVYS